MSDETVSKSDPRRVGQGRLSSGDTMLAQFLSMIEVRVKLIKSAITSEADRAILREVRESLIDFDAILINDVTEWRAAAWNEAYRLERLLALVEPAPGLLSELQRRLDEASDENVIAVARLQKRVELAALVEQNSSPPALKQGTEDTARRLLLNIIEEIQWVLQKKFQSRFIRKVAAYKIAWFALGAFALFALPYAWIYVRALWTEELTVKSWAGLPLWTALSAGLFGAFFSRLTYIQTHWNVISLDELKDAREYSSILLRGIVGMSGAVIVYFFLQSGILGGGLSLISGKWISSAYRTLRPKMRS